jgi:60 kDa SS-A/Ro ribonucleoprotein
VLVDPHTLSTNLGPYADLTEEEAMANPGLFQPAPRGKKMPVVDAVNEAGGVAYAFGDRHALAQLAVTGCLSNTFYADAATQLEKVLELASKCDSEFIAKTAMYARHGAFMKDMPALLMCVLASRAAMLGNEAVGLRQKANAENDYERAQELRRQAAEFEASRDQTAGLLAMVFPKVIDNGRMIRNFVQITRSGLVGSKSLGSMPQRLVKDFFVEHHDPAWLFRQAIGKNPSFGDIIKLARPKAKTPEQDALFGYLIGKVKQNGAGEPVPGEGPYREGEATVYGGKFDALPQIVKDFEAWKKAPAESMPPDLDFQMLSSQGLTTAQWAEIFRNGRYHFTLKNLNTAKRHGVFEQYPDMAELVAARLSDAEVIRKVKLFPYQLLAAYKNAAMDLPRKIVNAIHDALEVAVANVPAIEGRVLVFPDVSYSMHSSITGHSDDGRPPSEVRCLDVAALFSAALLRQNEEAVIVPVDTAVHTGYQPDPRNSVMKNAEELTHFGGGGTALSEAFRWANDRGVNADVVFVISDYESWCDVPYMHVRQKQTEMMRQWRYMQQRCPRAKLVCIDVQPYDTTQVPDAKNEVLNIGGWSDQCFTVIDSFLKGDPRGWVDAVQQVVI